MFLSISVTGQVNVNSTYHSLIVLSNACRIIVSNFCERAGVVGIEVSLSIGLCESNSPVTKCIMSTFSNAIC